MLECQRGDTMYETARKFSEQVYYTKDDLLKEMDSYLVEPIWQEIKAYRAFFRRDFHFSEKPYYIVQNPSFANKTLRIQTLLSQYEHTQPLMYEQSLHDVLNNEEQGQFFQYMQYLKLHPNIQAEDFLQSLFQQFQINDVYKEHIIFLLNEEEPFLLRLYSLVLIELKRSLSIVYYSFLMLQKSMKIISLIDFLEFTNECKLKDEQDLTYGYLEMLSRLQLILYKKMVLLNTDNEISTLLLQEKELIERFPALKKEQIQFYVQHRSLGHYYTIQNYIKECEVCYETARYSLDQLVEFHWYDKKKIGKKFVYHVV